MQSIEWTAWIAFFIAIFLLFISAFVSGSEIAFFSLKPKDFEIIKKKERKIDEVIIKLLKDSEFLLATILIVNNLVNIGIVTLSGYFFHSIFKFENNPFMGFLLLTIVLTAIILLFGEIIPKSYAGNNVLSFTRFSAYALSLLQRVFYPLSSILIHSTSVINKKIAKCRNHTSSLSMDELSQALELTSDKEMKDEKDLLEGVIKFGNKDVSDIMTSRIDIKDINIKSSYQEILTIIREVGYSRIPVYSETHDNIKGILYAKDLLLHINKTDTFRWQTLIRPAFFVPETKKIDKLLEEFKTRHIHMAIVVDEYGGVAGLVSFEDVVEEIVGEISDEYDDEEESFQRIDDYTYEFEAKTSLNDFCRILNIDESVFDKVAGEADSLAGLILEIKGDFPITGETIIYKNYKFTVLEVTKRRIIRIMITVNKLSKNEINET